MSDKKNSNIEILESNEALMKELKKVLTLLKELKYRKPTEIDVYDKEISKEKLNQLHSFRKILKPRLDETKSKGFG